MSEPIRVLFVCMGNICRSPTAEGVFRKLVEDEGVAHRFHIDSAGTGGWHAGEPPDHRAQAEARRRGIDIGKLAARQVRRDDFESFDYVLAMDRQNLSELAALCPNHLKPKLSLMMDFAPELPEDEVPDPYYGGAKGFIRVYDMLEAAAKGFFAQLPSERLGR